MKTLENISAKKRSNILTAKGELKSQFKKAIVQIMYEKHNNVHTGEYRGSGRHIRFVDFTFEIKFLLDAFGFKYSTGNDAPRGGQQGYYIKMSSTAYSTLINIL